MSPIYLVVFITVAVYQCHAQNNDVPRHYCGRNIGLALELICYTQDVVEKRSGSRNLAVYGNKLAPSFWSNPEEEVGWPWLAPQQAKSASMVARNKRYIVDECCRKPCTLSELINYCE